jgi:heme-degrading monooxygenase HmoA
VRTHRANLPHERTSRRRPTVFAVIFEVQPRKERFDDYLDLAKALKPKLEAIDGFIDVDRFASKRTEGRLLSLSIWRDEKSVIRWRTQGAHHAAQEKGRFEVFEDYRLRVGEITRDTAPPKGLSVEQQRFDATETGEAKTATITELLPRENTLAAKPDTLASHLGLRPGVDGLIDHETFESIYHPGKLLLLAGWRDPDTAEAWSPTKPDAYASLRHRHVRIIRDYGLFDRREAPQFYPEVKREGAKAGADEVRRQAAAR